MLRPLRDYQSDAINFVLAGSDPAGYYALPTGTGKTRIVTGLVSRLSGSLLILAHRKELIDQMAKAIIADVPGEDVGVIMNVQKEYAHRVTVACVATLTEKVLIDYLNLQTDLTPEGTLAILIDECHHAVPGSRYEQIIEAAKGTPGMTVRVIGCTATPFRSDKMLMQEVLPTCFFDRSIPDMQKSGWLCPVTWRSIEIDIAFDRIRTSRAGGESDFNADDLAEQISPQSAQIIEEIRPYLEKRPCVIFCCNVEHAHEMVRACNFAGIKAGSVWGAMGKNDREITLRQWKEGKIQVVTNVGVLTEGFDYTPLGKNLHGLGMVVIARPTKSPSLYLQILGRGTRLKPPSSEYQDCLVFDVGNCNLLETKQITMPKILPITEIDDDVPTGKKKSVRSGYKEDEEKAQKEKKPFILRINDPMSVSWIAWGFYARSGIYYAEIANDTYFVMLRGKSGLYCGLMITLDCFGQEQKYERIVDRDKPLLEMMHHANHIISSNGAKKLIDKSALWRREAASPKQLNFIRSSWPDLYDDTLTKGEAGMAIAWGKLRYPLAAIIREMKANEGQTDGIF